MESNSGGVSFCSIGIQYAMLYKQKYTPPHCFFYSFIGIEKFKNSNELHIWTIFFHVLELYKWNAESGAFGNCTDFLDDAEYCGTGKTYRKADKCMYLDEEEEYYKHYCGEPPITAMECFKPCGMIHNFFHWKHL